MRYIGSKRQVLPFIQKTIADTYGDISNAVVGDLFAGTACVGEMLKKAGATVISNDYMNFSYALQIFFFPFFGLWFFVYYLLP